MREVISTEARRDVRLLCDRLEPEAVRIERAADRLPLRLADSMKRKGKVGRARARQHVLDQMPVAPFHDSADALAWRFLKPLPTVPRAIDGADDVQDHQACLAAWGVVVNSAGRRISAEPFGAVWTVHCLCRLLDRSGFAADPVKAMWECHSQLILLGGQEGAQLFALPDVLVPAFNGGAFLASPRMIRLNDGPMLVCRTWLPADQLRTGQAANVHLWQRFVEGDTPSRPAVV